jgi:thiol-disulfide isomerase/thioredoxin
MIKHLMAIALVWSVGSAWALDVGPYSAQALSLAQQAGQAVALHFCAAWCTTCASQSQALEQLKSDPTLEEVSVLVVDYDKQKALRKTLKVRSPGTFVVFKGAVEVTRSSGQTAPASIWALLVKALQRELKAADHDQPA